MRQLFLGHGMIDFTCEMCGAEYCVDDDKAGKLARCKDCGQDITVPLKTGSPPAPMPVAPPPESSTTTDVESSIAASNTSASSTAVPAEFLKSWSQFQTPEGRKAARIGRPLDPHAEATNRKRNLIMIGAALFIGFIMPVCIASALSPSLRISMFNIEGMGESGIGWAGVVTLAFPLIAGALVLILQPLNARPRGVALISLFVVQLIVVLIGSDLINLENLLGRELRLVTFVYVMSFGSFWGLLICARARWYRPDATAGYIVGVVGALCTFVIFFVPFEGSMGIRNVFQVMRFAPVIGAFAIVGSLLVLATALVTVVNTPGRPLETVSKTARLAYVLLLCSWLVSAMIIAIPIVQGMMHAGQIAAAFIMFIKALLWIGGLLLLVPVGVTDLIIGDPDIDYSRCLKCSYDLRAAADRLCPECGLQNPV